MSAALISPPHHFLTQRMEIFRTCPFDDFNPIRSFAQRQARCIREFLTSSVQRHEEIVSTTLYGKFNFRILRNNDWPYIE